MKHEILTRQALRIFLASPGDVADERSLARDLIALLPYDPLLAGKITLEVVAWDSPGVGVPMLATMNPQQAIREGLPRPSQCDIVVVIFWARIGSPIDPGWEPGRKPDGQLYRSGTEWEYLEALQAAEKSGHPDILVYRRTGAPTPRLDDPNLDEILEQWKGVQAFFSEFRNKDGSNKRSYHSYNSPTDFKEKLTLALRALIKKRLDTAPVHPIGKSSRGKVCPSWKDPPYPGLRPFKFEEAPIFVGRSKETDALVEMLSDHTRSFLAVVGASGSGKSSLVTAGLFPRLHSGAIEGSGDWHCVTFTPGRSTGGPVSAMAQAFTTAFPAKGWTAGALEIRLLERGAIGELTAAALDNAPAWAKIVLFVDQLEELFTVVAQEQIDPFLDLLTRAAAAPRVRVIVTLRADFYPVTLKWLRLANLLNEGQFGLPWPDRVSLLSMITEPAALAGVALERGLTGRILSEMGDDHGALPLLAFALQQLYDGHSEEGLLQIATYEGFGGVRGAIARRAEEIYRDFQAVSTTPEESLHRLFAELVEINEQGLFAKRRASLEKLKRSPGLSKLVDLFTEARLLVSDTDASLASIVEVPHEALFSAWPRVRKWIDERREDLRSRSQLRLAANEWNRQGFRRDFLWPDKRNEEVSRALSRLDVLPSDLEYSFLDSTKRAQYIIFKFMSMVNSGGNSEELTISSQNLADLGELIPVADATLAAEQTRFLQTSALHRLSQSIDQPHVREGIGKLLGFIGDPRPGVGLREDGIPDIAWCKVLPADASSGNSAANLSGTDCYISKYPVTWRQFKAFLNAPDGYKERVWWSEFPQVAHRMPQVSIGQDSYPVVGITWFEARAFCRWLSHRLAHGIRLPTEWEWQQAANGGAETRTYPWGQRWNVGMANTRESGLLRPIAVGLYPRAISPAGALDISGNVWEWCLNSYRDPLSTDLERPDWRSIRGGSAVDDRTSASTCSRVPYAPAARFELVGFRLLREGA